MRSAPGKMPSPLKSKRHLELAPRELESGLGFSGPETDWAGGPPDGAEPNDEVGRLLQVGELAKATGKTVRAIHFYEDMGLIKPVERSKGRYRLFSPDTALRVRWIAKLQRLGFSLPEIERLVREQAESDSAMFAATRLREVYLEKLRATQVQLTELRELEQELVASLRFLHSCDSSCHSELPTTSCPTCDRHAEAQKTPELVAGLRVR